MFSTEDSVARLLVHWVQVAGWYGRQVTPQQELCYLREAVRHLWTTGGVSKYPMRARGAFLRATISAQPYSPTLHTYLKGKAVVALARYRGIHAGYTPPGRTAQVGKTDTARATGRLVRKVIDAGDAPVQAAM